MIQTLDDIAAALKRALPNLANIAPLTRLGEGFDSIALETAGGVVIRIAKSKAVDDAYALEKHLLPALWQHRTPEISLRIPRPAWYAPPNADFPHGVIGYPKIPGTPLEIATLKNQSYAEVYSVPIGGFLAWLHRVPLDVIDLHDDFHARRSDWQAQHARTMPHLRSLLTGDEYDKLDRWWDALLRDARMAHYTPVIQHGDLWVGNILIDGVHLTGVIDWSNAGVGDPAQDFAPLLYVGEHFLLETIKHYQAFNGRLNDGFMHRLWHLWALREFDGIAWALIHDDEAELHEGIAKLRKGPVLHPAGLDGWS